MSTSSVASLSSGTQYHTASTKPHHHKPHGTAGGQVQPDTAGPGQIVASAAAAGAGKASAAQPVAASASAGSRQTSSTAVASVKGVFNVTA